MQNLPDALHPLEVGLQQPENADVPPVAGDIEMKILRLTLHKKAFEVMVTGEKQHEYRNVSDWIDSRLMKWDGMEYDANRHYDAVEFTNGYGKDKPRFLVEYKGFEWLPFAKHEYSNGLIVDVGEVYEIHLGNILHVENYELSKVS